MLISIQIGHIAGEPLWQKLLLAVIGPATTAIVGSLLAALAVSRLLDRKRRKDADRDMREQIVQDMARIAATFYFQMLQFRRARTSLARDARAQAMRPWFKRLLRSDSNFLPQPNMVELAGNYGNFRASADTLEVRLGAYFEGDEVRERWHAVSDLLTVRYHDTMGTLESMILNANARSATKFHSGLTVEELGVSSLLVKAYKSALSEAIDAAKQGKRDEGKSKRSNLWRAKSVAKNADGAGSVRIERAD
ncbi:hypothetical protein RZN05_06070 [Sphingomonas sp. HF-S4]|uniref:Uncharacterized protein n=1 Tax=Sphingomonas agrestis TaxID=3080540 RepID=A0ABU3Y563_9SPHN|nr:hypothetical protein [Sphingomonas sp. HF-S4]MDV3456544.1 hypothetical protein [Sphingomonas sp. HF-S4]